MNNNAAATIAHLDAAELTLVRELASLNADLRAHAASAGPMWLAATRNTKAGLESALRQTRITRRRAVAEWNRQEAIREGDL